MDNTITPDVITPGKPQKKMKMTANQIAIATLRGQGMNNADTARELGVSKSYVTAIDKKMNGKYSLQDRFMVKAAHKAVKSLLAGEPFGSIKEVKDSTSLQAAKMVYDRFEPVLTESPIASGNTFTQIIINSVSAADATPVRVSEIPPIINI